MGRHEVHSLLVENFQKTRQAQIACSNSVLKTVNCNWLTIFLDDYGIRSNSSENFDMREQIWAINRVQVYISTAVFILEHVIF